MSTAIQLSATPGVTPGVTPNVMPAVATQTALPLAAEFDSFWLAIESRDTRMDGIVYYGVRSTGVYCRPSCPSRRPRREKVDFYFDPDSAERSGFRACLRCKPRLKAEHAVLCKIDRKLVDHPLVVPCRRRFSEMKSTKAEHNETHNTKQERIERSHARSRNARKTFLM